MGAEYHKVPGCSVQGLGFRFRVWVLGVFVDGGTFWFDTMTLYDRSVDRSFSYGPFAGDHMTRGTRNRDSVFESRREFGM